jgi:hypothetical protein
LAKKKQGKKQSHEAELEEVRRDRKQSRNLKSLGDLNNKTTPSVTTPQPSKDSESISAILPSMTLPKRKNPVEELAETLRSKKPKVVMVTGTISLEISTAEGKMSAPLIPDSIFTLEFRGATGLVKIASDDVRKILQALGVHV